MEVLGEPIRMFFHDVIVVRQQPAEVCRAQLNPHFTAEKNESPRDEETHLPSQQCQQVAAVSGSPRSPCSTLVRLSSAT